MNPVDFGDPIAVELNIDKLFDELFDEIMGGGGFEHPAKMLSIGLSIA